MRTNNLRVLVAVMAATAISVGGNLATAQDFESSAISPVTTEESPYAATAPRVQQPTIAQQKAQFRAEQRMGRMASMRWYGFSASRPKASALPFTTMYSPAWQMPGGRPFGWYFSSRPVVIIDNSTVGYR